MASIFGYLVKKSQNQHNTTSDISDHPTCGRIWPYANQSKCTPYVPKRFIRFPPGRFLHVRPQHNSGLAQDGQRALRAAGKAAFKPGSVWTLSGEHYARFLIRDQRAGLKFVLEVIKDVSLTVPLNDPAKVHTATTRPGDGLEIGHPAFAPQEWNNQPGCQFQGTLELVQTTLLHMFEILF